MLPGFRAPVSGDSVKPEPPTLLDIIDWIEGLFPVK